MHSLPNLFRDDFRVMSKFRSVLGGNSSIRVFYALFAEYSLCCEVNWGLQKKNQPEKYIGSLHNNIFQPKYYQTSHCNCLVIIVYQKRNSKTRFLLLWITTMLTLILHDNSRSIHIK